MKMTKGTAKTTMKPAAIKAPAKPAKAAKAPVAAKGKAMKASYKGKM